MCKCIDVLCIEACVRAANICVEPCNAENYSTHAENSPKKIHIAKKILEKKREKIMGREHRIKTMQITTHKKFSNFMKMNENSETHHIQT